MKFIIGALLGVSQAMTINRSHSHRSDPSCGSATCMNFHGDYNAGLDAFEMNNTIHSGKNRMGAFAQQTPHTGSLGLMGGLQAYYKQGNHINNPNDPGYAVDYKVNDFGMEQDVKDNFGNLKVAEGVVGQNWTWEGFGKKNESKFINPAKATPYNFNPTLDSDVITTQGHYGEAEKKYGKWDYA